MEKLSHLNQKIPYPCPRIIKFVENIRGSMQKPRMLYPLNIFALYNTICYIHDHCSTL